MNPIIHELTLDLRQPGTQQVIYGKQDDSMTRAARLTLYDGGTVYDVPPGSTLQIAYCKRDLKGGLYDKMPDNSPACTFSGNVVTAKLHPQMFSVSGVVACELRIVNADGDQLSTFSWTLQVDASATAHMKSQDYFNTGSLREAVNKLRDDIGEISNLQTAVKSNLVDAINYLRQRSVTSVNDVSPNEATGNVALVADDIPCRVYKTQFQGSLQKLIDELCDGIELDYTQIYEEWKKRAGGDSSVRAFFLSDEIIEPGAYVVYAAGYTWKLRYTTAKSGDGSAVWRWVESYSEDGFFSLRLYAEQDAVLIIEPDGDGYWVYNDEFALKSYVDERTEKDVTAEYEAWQAEHPEGTEREFLWTLPDGTYRLGADTYMQRITTDDETFRWITEYSDICEISLYQGNRCVFSFDGATTVKLGEKLLATEEYVDERTEKDVTAEYEAWYPTAPPNARQPHHFLLTLPDGQYRLTWDGYQAYRMSRITTPVGNVLQQLYVTQEQFFYFYAYVNDDLVCELSTEENYFLINGRRYATEEFVEKQIAAATNDLKSYIDQKIAQALGG